MNERAGVLMGLDEREAAERLARHGPNTLEEVRTRRAGEIIRSALREPMFVILLIAAGLYLVVGDIGEGLFLSAGALVSIGLVVLQEARSERALAALRELAEPFARVLRSGVERRIPARELVPGDVVLVGEGERLPADGLHVAGDVLTIDESLLTGESAPVARQPQREGRAGAPDEDSRLFAGTLIVGGQGVMQVAATGAATQFGRIGASLAAIETEPTLLQKTTARLIARLGLAAILFCALVAIAYGLVRGEWFGGALAGITLAIALLPEEFPMVLAIFMAMGSWRLARRNVLVRRPAVLETLGAATLLCVDKTGTLTENRMTVAALWVDGALHELGDPADLHEAAAHLIGRAALASALRPVDPMDRAVRDLAEGLEIDAAPGGAPVMSRPLQPNLLAVIQAWSEPGGATVVAAKGAPEAIFSLAHLDQEPHERMHEVASGMAARGLRVLGVASRRHDGPVSDDLASQPFTFEGLVGFHDPLRPDAPAALAQARRAGVDVAMITGDYPATALEIARRCGIDATGGVLTGPEIAALAGDELRVRLRRTRIFARVRPEQKLALVQGFKANGEVVAMTGDGVNDAPALEAAHIGIAMGRRGADVAREAADIVLLDDSFASIVGGVRLGRRIFANLRKALVYVSAIHVPVAGLALLPIVLGLPPMLFPMHVVLLELIIDPVCSLVFESEPSEKEAMTRPPRPVDEPLFGLPVLLFGLLQGAVVLAGVLGLFMAALAAGMSAEQARATAFVALVLGNLVLAFADSAETGSDFFDRRRVAFWAIAVAAVATLALILALPGVARVFSVAMPPAMLLAAAVAVALLAGGWYGGLRKSGLLPRN